MIGAVANHLWQSTAYAAVVAALAVALRGARARVRHALWLSASLKFLFPFAALVAIGQAIAWAPAARQLTPPAVTAALTASTSPFGAELPLVDIADANARVGTSTGLVALLALVWLGGVAVMVLSRWRLWRSIRAAVRASTPTAVHVAQSLSIEVRACPGLLEPGIVGLRKPLLLLPADIERHLTRDQLEAVIAHELCHVARRDNLTSALHMAVEAIFWFHPVVWWIGARLMHERERACDEHVLRVCASPDAYAEGILAVCKRYVDAPIACTAGVGGGHIRRRIEAIVSNRLGAELTNLQRVVLAGAVMFTLAVPFAAGVLTTSVRAAQNQNAVERLSFAAASVKVNRSGEIQLASRVQPGGRYSAVNVPLDVLIALAFQPIQRFELDGIPDWARTSRYDIDARADGDVPPARVWLMLQSLLADRFGLATHREPRQQQVYVLTVAKPGQLGSGLHAHTGDDGCLPAASAPPNLAGALDPSRPLPAPVCGGWSGAPALGRLSGQAVTLDMFIRAITGQLGRMVLDRTGMTGTYDISIEFAPPSPPPAASAQPPSDRPSIFTAVEEQLGLKLVPGVGPVNVLVVDRLERPTEN